MKVDRNDIHVYEVTQDVDERIFAEHEREIRQELAITAARRMARDLLESRFAKVEERDADNMRREFIYRVQIVDPEGADFAKQLCDEREASRRGGLVEAAKIVREQAAKFAALDSHGPAQALALSGVADAIDRYIEEH